MSHHQKYSNQPPKSGFEREFFNSIIQQQKRRFDLEEKQIELEEKKLEYNTKLSELSLQYESEMQKNKSTNYRKVIITQGVIVAIIVILFLSFIGFALMIGKDAIVNQVIIFFTHLVTLLIGMFLGNKLNKNSIVLENRTDMHVDI